MFTFCINSVDVAVAVAGFIADVVVVNVVVVNVVVVVNDVVVSRCSQLLS